MAITYESLAVAPKAQEATNLKVSQLQQKANEQPNIAMDISKQNEQKMNQTQKASEKENSQNNFDAKEKGSNEYSKQEAERKKKEEEKKKEELKKMLGCTFDITV